MGWLQSALTLAALAAQAEITGTVTAVSDYDFRGITQTSQDPALQGSIDYAHDSGFYAGAWAQQRRFRRLLRREHRSRPLRRASAAARTSPGTSACIYYTYPGAEDIDFPEIYAGLGWNWLSGKLWYSNDFGNSDESALLLRSQRRRWNCRPTSASRRTSATATATPSSWRTARATTSMGRRRHLHARPLRPRPEVRRRQRPRRRSTARRTTSAAAKAARSSRSRPRSLDRRISTARVSVAVRTQTPGLREEAGRFFSRERLATDGSIRSARYASRAAPPPACRTPRRCACRSMISGGDSAMMSPVTRTSRPFSNARTKRRSRARRACPESASSSIAPISPRLRRSITCGRPCNECTPSAQ